MRHLALWPKGCCATLPPSARTVESWAILPSVMMWVSWGRAATRCQPMRYGRVNLGRLFGSAVDMAACPNLTDVPARMSVHRRIPDVAERRAEGRSLTRSGSCWSQSSICLSYEVSKT